MSKELNEVRSHIREQKSRFGKSILHTEAEWSELEEKVSTALAAAYKKGFNDCKSMFIQKALNEIHPNKIPKL